MRTKRRAALGFGRRLGEGRGEYLKGQTCGARSSGGRLRAAGAISRRSPAPLRGRGRTRQMGPTCQRNGARGRLVSGCSEVGGGALLAGLALLALGREVGRAEKKGGRRRSRPRGKGEKWAEPETGRGRGNSFPFSILCLPFLLKQNTFQNQI